MGMAPFRLSQARLACDVGRAHACLIPFDCDEFARHALYTLIENVAETRADHNEALEIEGIVVNQYGRTATSVAHSFGLSRTRECLDDREVWRESFAKRIVHRCAA
jgi:cellulose biosynthesis protein BcsQ